MKFFSLIIFLSFAEINCDEFKFFGKQKIDFLKKNIENFPSSKILSKDTILSIVSPEYLTFSDFKNKVEISFIYTFFGVGNNEFKEISFGPFQMQLEFIDKYLKISKKDIFSNSDLNKYDSTNYQILIENLHELNDTEFQWKILKTFVDHNYKFISENLSGLEKLKILIRIYNSGNSELKYNKSIYSKISCKNLTYQDWCLEMLKW